MAIRNFKNRATEQIFNGKLHRRLPQQIQRRAKMRLIQLHSAVSIEDMMLPPSNRLEKLRGDHAGQYSVRINNQFRICFNWQEGNAFDVEIVDYH